MKAPYQQQIHSALMTSALPVAEDFTTMREHGYEIVISMCQSIDSVTLENEANLVYEAGMKYIHLPVTYLDPQLDDYLLLKDMLNALYPRKVWLHCAKNYRVSAFMFLYNTLERSTPVPEAEEIMHRVWKPIDIWQKLIDETMEKYAYQYI